MSEDHTQSPCAGSGLHAIRAECPRHDPDTRETEHDMELGGTGEATAVSNANDGNHTTSGAAQIDRSEAVPDGSSSLAGPDAQLISSSVSLSSEQTDGEYNHAASHINADARRPGNLRNTSSKIANLRAAFENDSAAVDMAQPKRRFHSGERASERVVEKEREYWKEIGRIRDERDKESGLKQVFQAKCVELEDQIRLLKQQVEERGGKVHEDEGMTREGARDSKIIPSLALDDAEAKGREDGNVEMPTLELQIQKTRSTQVDALERQVADLKRTISTSTRMDPVRADTDLAQEMGVLHHELQNWIVNTYRRAKTSFTSAELVSKLDTAAVGPNVDALRRTYSTFDASAKLATYQSTAMIYIMDIFTANLLFGLGSSEQEWQARVLQTAESLTHVLSPHAYNRWRSVTLDVIRHTNSLQEATEAAAMSIVEKICVVLAAVSEIAASDSQRLALNSIIRRAISLAHLFHVQRAQYEFTLPIAGSVFQKETMEDTSADDSDLGHCRPVRCATFLSVIKVGDEFGDSLHLRNVLVKARVLCSTSEHP